MYKDTGLICEHQTAFMFLQDVSNGKVGRSGKEPPIQKVLTGQVEFKLKETKTRMTWALSGIYLSALSDLRENQLLLLSRSDNVSLRSSPLLKQWRANLKQQEIELRAK